MTNIAAHPRGTVPALTHWKLSRNILTARICVTFTGQMVDSSLLEPAEKLTGCFATWGESARGEEDAENMAERGMGLGRAKLRLWRRTDSDRNFVTLFAQSHPICSGKRDRDSWINYLLLLLFAPVYCLSPFALGVSADVPPQYKHRLVSSLFCFPSLKNYKEEV